MRNGCGLMISHMWIMGTACVSTLFLLATGAAATELLSNRSFDQCGSNWEVAVGLPPFFSPFVTFGTVGEADLQNAAPYPTVQNLLWQTLSVTNAGGVSGTASITMNKGGGALGNGLAVYLEYTVANGATHRQLLLNPDNAAVVNWPASSFFSANFTLPAEARRIVRFVMDKLTLGQFRVQEFSLDITVPTPPALRITVSPSGGGTTIPTAGENHVYTAGQKITLTASSASGYRFAGWTGDATGNLASGTVVMDRSRTVTATFTPVAKIAPGPDMKVARMGHGAVALPNGTNGAARVAVFGGHGAGFSSLASFEIWDDVANEFALHTLPFPFDGGALVQLADGTWLLAGGATDLGGAPGYATAQLFDPASNTAVSTGTTLTRARVNCNGARLSDGRVLIAGGWYDLASASHGEIYNPQSKAFLATGPLNVARALPLVVPTADGGAVVAGGLSPFGQWTVETVEAYSVASNAFTIRSSSLFANDPGWILTPWIPLAVSAQRLGDGRYVFGARRGTRDYALAVFDPVTKVFTKVQIDPGLPQDDAYVFPPVLAADDSAAVTLLIATRRPGRVESLVWPSRVNLTTGLRTSSPSIAVANDYWVGSAGVVRLANGRMFLTGGTTSVDAYYNFHPTAHTVMVSHDELTVGTPTVIDNDVFGFFATPSNRRLVRDHEGRLFVAYTPWRAPENAGKGFNYIKSTTDNGVTWSAAVRTEDMPDSSSVQSLDVDTNNVLYQGFTFNVGSYLTTSTNHGRTWTQPVPLLDGGWALFDYQPHIAFDSAGALAAVMLQGFGWLDYPLNVMFKTSADKGTTWSGSLDLSLLPDTDAMDYGAFEPRFCFGPGDRRFVTYDSLAAGGAKARMLVVGDANGWATPVRISSEGVPGFGGDQAVDDAGLLHLAWIETNAQTQNGQLVYGAYSYRSRSLFERRVLTESTVNVSGATVGVYADNRVLIAYDQYNLQTRAYEGVYVRTSADDFAVALAVSDCPGARSPGLRWSPNMVRPDTVDLTWVEPGAAFGFNLMHNRLLWSFANPDAGTLTLTSNADNAPFSVTGPRPVSADTGTVREWSDVAMPVGRYTVTWGDLPGFTAPEPVVVDVSLATPGTAVGTYTPGTPRFLTLTVNPAEGGTLTRVPSGTVAAGRYAYSPAEVVTLTAAPASGFRFVSWTGAVDTPRFSSATITLGGDQVVAANFAASNQFFVTVQPTTNGTVGLSATTVALGGTLTLEMTPDAGYQVADVIVNGASVGGTQHYDLTGIDADVSVAVTFLSSNHYVTATATPYGGGTVRPDKAVYLHGATAQITATPADGYAFAGWFGDAAGTDRVAHVVMSGEKQAEARFARVSGPVCGDVNQDGVLRIDDAALAKRMVLGLDLPNLPLADLDADGRITTADVGAILRSVVGRSRTLVDQTVEPAATLQIIVGAGAARVGVPGGLLLASQSLTLRELTVAPAMAAPLVASAIAYDLRLGTLAAFVQPIEVEVPLDPALVAQATADPSNAVRVARWDEGIRQWTPIVATVDSTSGKLLMAAERPGLLLPYVVPIGNQAAAIPAADRQAAPPPPGTRMAYTEHFIYTFDQRLNGTIDGVTYDAEVIMQVLSDIFEAAYNTYDSTAYPVAEYGVTPGLLWGQRDRRGMVNLPLQGVPIPEAEYNVIAKWYNIPLDYDTLENLVGTVGHEQFHMVQNQTWTFPTMLANLWFMDVTADYAGFREAYVPPQPLRSRYTIDPGTTMTSADGNHRYAVMSFMLYLVNHGVNFKAMYDYARNFSTVTHALDNYVLFRTKRTMASLYQDYLQAVLFDQDYRETGADLLLPALTSFRTALAVDTHLQIANPESMALLYAQPTPRNPQDKREEAVTVCQFRSPIPNSLFIDLFIVPHAFAPVGEGTPLPGGQTPWASFDANSVTPAYHVLYTGPKDLLFLTAFSYQADAAVDVRLSQVVLTLTPSQIASVQPDTAVTFQAHVEGLPNCIGPVKVTWDFGDASPEVEFCLPQPTTDYTIRHNFSNRTSKYNSDVQFWLWDRVKDTRLAHGTAHVTVDPVPLTLRVVPATVTVTVGDSVSFALSVSPVALVESQQRADWDFGDGTVKLGTGAEGFTELHAYATQGRYTVKVRVYNRDEPDVTVVRASSLVTVDAPLNNMDHVCVPDEGIDYTKLHKVVDTRTGGGADVYYVSTNNVRQGRFHTFYVYNNASAAQVVTEVCACYVNGQLEGLQREFWQDGGTVRREVHYLAGQRDGSDLGWDNTGAPMWSQHYVHERLEGTSFMYDLGAAGESHFPELHTPDGVFAELVSGESGQVHESCPFAGNLRHGICVRRYGASNGTLEQQGTFTRGAKTGVWQYYTADGKTTSVNYGN